MFIKIERAFLNTRSILNEYKKLFLHLNGWLRIPENQRLQWFLTLNIYKATFLFYFVFFQFSFS